MLKPTFHFYPVFADAIRELARREVVLDLGTFHQFRKELAPFRQEFSSTRYYCLDYKAEAIHGELNPHVSGDIQKLPFKTASVDGVLVKCVLEHLPEPQKAVDEIHRVLRPGGLVVSTTPWLHPYHGTGGMKNSDYYRYSRDALRHMFRGYSDVQIHPLGGPWYVLNAFLPNAVNNVLFSRPLVGAVNALDRRMARPDACYEYLVRAVK